MDLPNSVHLVQEILKGVYHLFQYALGGLIILAAFKLVFVDWVTDILFHHSKGQ